jgi:hypothetical protein
VGWWVGKPVQRIWMVVAGAMVWGMLGVGKVVEEG